MDNQIEQAGHLAPSPVENGESPHDYAYVSSTARIALYDDLLSAPRVTEIAPAPTADYIENLASSVYEQAKASGGTIPYTVIREVSENFIHARFAEVTVSILDGGNTIRFADQGPGIRQKEKAQLPGFTSAVEPMKRYIRGVGSGLPIVKEYLDFSHGTIAIEDNLGTGSVVTISLERHPSDVPGGAGEPAGGVPGEMERIGMQGQGPLEGPWPQAQEAPLAHPSYQAAGYPAAAVAPAAAAAAAYQAPPAYPYAPSGYPAMPAAGAGYGYPAAPGVPVAAAPHDPYRQYPTAALASPLTQRERDFLALFLSEGALGVTDLAHLTGAPASSTHAALSKLEKAGLIEKTHGQKRVLTNLGYQVARSL